MGWCLFPALYLYWRGVPGSWIAESFRTQPDLPWPLLAVRTRYPNSLSLSFLIRKVGACPLAGAVAGSVLPVLGAGEKHPGMAGCRSLSSSLLLWAEFCLAGRDVRGAGNGTLGVRPLSQ